MKRKQLRLAMFIVAIVTTTTVNADVSPFLGDEGVDYEDDTEYLAERGYSMADGPLREHRKLQKEILALLGLRKRPNPSNFERHNSAPLFMMDLYQSIMQDDSGPAASNRSDEDLSSDFSMLAYYNRSVTDPTVVGTADMIMSFPNQARNLDREDRRQRNHERFHFNINEIPDERESVTKAELRVFKLPTGACSNAGNCTFIVAVYQVLKADRQKYLVYLDSMYVSSDYIGWLVFDVTSVINDWLLYPQTNHGFQMDTVAVDSDERLSPLEIGMVGVDGYEDQQAFMVAFFSMDKQLHIRRTRAAMSTATDTNTYSNTYNDRAPSGGTDEDYWYANYDTNTYSSRRSCQKRSLYVSFKDLGWQDFIIAPDGYAAYYCRGECSFPLNPHMNATNHAIVQTLVHLMYSDTIPKPCCTPTKLSAISVLYYGKNSNVILKKYRNMVVRSCGCH